MTDRDKTRKTLDETMAYLESGASLPSVDDLAEKGLIKVVVKSDEREQDVAIAKAMGIAVVEWPFHNDLECGGLDPVMEDEEGKPDFGLSLGPDSEFAKYQRETAIWEPAYRHFYVRTIPGNIDLYTHSPIPHYGTPEGSWLILDYGRTHPAMLFSSKFADQIENLIPFDQRDCYPYECVQRMLLNLTLVLIKEAAWRASQ